MAYNTMIFFVQKLNEEMKRMLTLTLSNSSRNTFNICPKFWYWKYIRGLYLPYGSTALRFGSVWHSILDFYYKGKILGQPRKAIEITQFANERWIEESKDREFIEDYRTFDTLLDLFFNHYLINYANDELFPLASEREITLPIYKDSSCTIIFNGILDRLACFAGSHNIVLIDDKTTSDYTHASSKLLRNPQLLGYAYACRELQLTEQPVNTIMQNNTFFSARKKRDETYGEMTIGFSRPIYILDEQDLDIWKVMYIDTAKQILTRYKENNWTQNLSSCLQGWGVNKTECQYLELCTNGEHLHLIERYKIDIKNKIIET